MRAPLCLLGLLLGSLAGCTTIDRLGDHCPPPDFGRPGWVRTCAGVGAWTGGILGTVASIVLLPVTYPISLLAEDELGAGGRTEFLLFPAVGGAAFGHALLGSPTDAVDYVFRRAWVDAPDPVNSYEIVPVQVMAPPSAQEPATEPAAKSDGSEG